MRTTALRLAALAFVALTACTAFSAEVPNDKLRAKIDQWIATAKVWAEDPALVQAIAEQNATTPAGYDEMTQEKWAELQPLDPFLRKIARSPASAFLRAKKADIVTEAFVSDAKGRKVGFLDKPTRWTHLGQPKHDQPMANEVWQGKLEMDRSSGMLQIQFGIPVLKDGKPIGSLVVGLGLSELANAQ